MRKVRLIIITTDVTSITIMTLSIPPPDLIVLARLHDIIIDEDVLTVEFHLILHVAEQTPYQCCQVDDLVGTVFLEDGAGLGTIPGGTIV